MTARGTAGAGAAYPTPGPWTIETHPVSPAAVLIRGGDGDPIGILEFPLRSIGENVANARRIVRAVNNHAPLVAALRDLADNPHDTAAQVRVAAVLAQIDGAAP